MNLADAIRQAALRQTEDLGQKESPTMSTPHFSHEEPTPTSTPSFDAAPHSTHQPEPHPAFQATAPAQTEVDDEADATPPPTWGGDTGKLTITTDPEQASEYFATDAGTGEPVPIPEAGPALASGNVVRFEIFLSPEQLSCLFRALVATQHSMMTMREAAAYLRIPAATLEQLANESKIPALQIEGRWRFPKSGIDEWVMLQSFRDGEVGDAA